MSGSSGILTVERVSVRVGGRPIVDDVSFDVGAGEIVAIVGPNGSGKSTLLHAIAGVRGVDSGRVLLGGDDVQRMPRRTLARQLALVEQMADTDTDLLARDVVQLGRAPYRARWGGEHADDERVTAAALAEVGAAALGGRRWSTLSGGERQRVHIARALAQQPDVLLLDEPTNHLDVQHQFELMELLGRLPTTIVVVLHDLHLAARYADRVVVLRDGAVEAIGSPSMVLSDAVLHDVFGVYGDVRRVGARLAVTLLGAASGGSGASVARGASVASGSGAADV